jgi:hypothetical protein
MTNAATREMQGMGPVEVVQEFQKGCVDTKTRGEPAHTCSECFSAAIELLMKQGFKKDEAASLLSGPAT